jgi:tetratricopeptide (TPR) repeat protein
MCNIYRKAQQWPELAMVLVRRADGARTPSRSRDLRSDAAEVLEQQLSDSARARDLYEQVLAADPSHERASEALVRIYERSSEYALLVKLLERRADAVRGEDHAKTLCRIAELYENQLDDPAEAMRRYDAVLAFDAQNIEALRGLDRVYSKTGRYHELLKNLDAQLRLAPTPRQKISLWQRIASIHEEEFLDHQRAADALESVLSIDATHEPALTELVRHYRALDRWEDVATLYERLLKLASTPEKRLQLTLARGRVLAEQIGSQRRASEAFEAALQIDPQHGAALEALAKLRERAGDADAALRAIEALAQNAAAAEAKAELYVRAAKLLESQGDRDGAIERYKLALDATPKDAAVAAALREAYVTRGDVNAALQLLEREIETTEGDRAKAKLAAEVASLARSRLKDDARAEAAAKRAVAWDPTSLPALLVLAEVAFEDRRFLEASHHYEALAGRADLLDRPQAVRVLTRYVDALTQTGSTEKALAPMEMLLRIAPDDPAALERVAQVTFEHGSAERAVELYDDLLQRFGGDLPDSERALAQYRYGEALRKSGRNAAAISALEDASELDPSNARVLVALAAAYEADEQWEKVIGAKTRQLDLASGDDRVQVLLEIGDIASAKLGDRMRAAKSFVAALEERPDDRKLLTKLMQLYSEEKDWNKLVDVVLRLADFVDDPKQKLKYLHTAAIVSARQMGDVERALQLYDQVLDLDPTMKVAVNESIELHRGRGDHEGVERMLQRKLQLATEANDQQAMLETFDQLGQLYEKQLGWTDRAIDAYEAAQTLDPDNLERTELLAQLYTADPERHLDKAVEAHATLLRHNPYRSESYRSLRRLYTESKQADSAWCLCQVLYATNLAEPDEERFYKRMRAETAAPAQTVLTDEDWLTMLLHPSADPLLTSVFALIEAAVIAKSGETLEELGYDAASAVDLAQHSAPMAQTLFWATSVLGLEPPPTFENANYPGGLDFLHAHSPALVLGSMALEAEVPPQAAAFIAARHLTYYRPGMYVRQLVPFGTGLKAWLFAAIKMIAPQFPVAADLEGPVRDNLAALETGMARAAREHLARIVSKLLQQGGSLDLKQWVSAIDLTADRAGFVLAHDLELATDVIKASDEGSSSVPTQERVKELLLFASSESYLALRRKLGISIDS